MIKKITAIFITIFFITGCSFEVDKLENSNIKTTAYPITYLVEELFGEYSTIESIYPEESNIDEYKLTKKLINSYAKSDLFVYNGLTKEKEIAKNFVNKNRDILLIDASYGLNYKNSIDELWTSPNNYLIMAKNINDNLTEYLSNKFIIEEVNEKYEEIKEKLSILEADLRKSANAAIKNEKNLILCTSNNFDYLETYGYIVYNVSSSAGDELNTENILNKMSSKAFLAFILDESYYSAEVLNLLSNHDDKKIVFKDYKNAERGTNYISELENFVYKIHLLSNQN